MYILMYLLNILDFWILGQKGERSRHALPIGNTKGEPGLDGEPAQDGLPGLPGLKGNNIEQ